MNIEELKSSMTENYAGLFSNLSISVPIPKETGNKGKSATPFFDDSMAETSQFLVFEEIYNNNNGISYNRLEDKIYDRYDIILNKHNSNFIFSLKMPFYEWIKLQIELGNIIIKINDGNSSLSISKPIEELLKGKINALYNVTGEIYKKAAS